MAPREATVAANHPGVEKSYHFNKVTPVSPVCKHINHHQSASPTAFLLADRVGKALCGSALRQPWTNGGPVAHHANTPVPVAPAARKWMKWLRYDGGERIQTDPNSLNYPLVI